MLWGCPSAWACDWRVPYVCQEYATAIRRHEENSSHLLQRNAVPEQSSKANISFGKVERCIWDRFQTWVHPMSRLSSSRIWFDASLQLNDVSLWSFCNWYWIVWQQNCKLCRASARCFNNCIASVSLTMVLNKTSAGAVQSYNIPWESCYGGVHLLGHVIEEFPTSVKSMPQPSDLMKRRVLTLHARRTILKRCI